MKIHTGHYQRHSDFRELAESTIVPVMVNSFRETLALLGAVITAITIVMLSVWVTGTEMQSTYSALTWGLGFIFQALAVDNSVYRIVTINDGFRFTDSCLVTKRCVGRLHNRHRNIDGPVGGHRVVQAIEMRQRLSITTFQCAVDGLQGRAIQVNSRRRCVLPDLFWSRGANDRRREVGFAQNPGQSELRHADTETRCNRFQTLHTIQ